MKAFEISYSKACEKQKKTFWGHFRLCERSTYLRAPIKLCLAVILRGQSTFYDQWFMRYGF